MSTREEQIRQAADLLGDEYYLVALVQHIYRDLWSDMPPGFWFNELKREIVELQGSYYGDHPHPIEWELTQIAALCINWLRHHARPGWILECVDLLDKREVESGDKREASGKTDS